MKEEKKMIGYKSFDENMQCRGFQYEVGKTYEEDEAILCAKGFHFCENPLDTLNYYDLTEANFAIVEAEGVSDNKEENGDSKRVAKKITIKSKLDLPMFIKHSFDFVWESCGTKTLLDKAKEVLNKASSGDSAQLASSGDSAKLASSGHYAKLASSGHSAQLASSGDSAQLASSGHYAKLASSGHSAQLASSGHSAKLASKGQDSIVAGIGVQNIGKGAVGNWLVLAEWEYDNSKSRWVPVCVKSEKVDGKKLKADTYYKLQNGKFTVCE